MEKIIFICNTYYQMITAIQLRNTRFINDNVYLVLTNHSKHAEGVSLRLREAKCFKEVYFANVRELDQDKHGMAAAVSSILSGVDGNARWMKEMRTLKCDEFIYYNLSVSTIQLYALLIKNNPSLRCSRMEEGILSYDAVFHEGDGEMPIRIKYIFKIRRLLKRKNLTDCIDNFYCFYPEVYHGKLAPIKIAPISDNERMKKILTKSFDISLLKDEYKEKYIFFTGVGDFEAGQPIGETEVVKKVADLVGKDNLLVKQHPRDSGDVYEKAGLHVDYNSSVPWEAIQLSRNFDGKVFLSVNSSSILSSILMTEDRITAYYLYPLCDLSGNMQAKMSVATLEQLFEESSLPALSERVRVINRMEDILRDDMNMREVEG